MTTVSSALNYNFAYAEASRIASAARGAEETVAAQLRQAAADAPFQVGSTITARYKYTVAEDGSLIPQQTRITTTAPDDATRNQNRKSQRQATRDGLDARRQSFGDLARPKPELSPTDELRLFAALEQVPSPLDLAQSAKTQPAAPVVQAKAEVLDENGDPVEAELLTGNNEAAAQPEGSIITSIFARAQFAAAGLYARNNDVTYRVNPIVQFAA
jgi:hypothetical protein